MSAVFISLAHAGQVCSTVSGIKMSLLLSSLTTGLRKKKGGKSGAFELYGYNRHKLVKLTFCGSGAGLFRQGNAWMCSTNDFEGGVSAMNRLGSRDGDQE